MPATPPMFYEQQPLVNGWRQYFSISSTNSTSFI